MSLSSHHQWSNIEELKIQFDLLLLLHNVINNKIYSTSDRQLPSYCALQCDNKQTNKSTLKAAEGGEKLTVWRPHDQFQMIPKKALG